MENTEGVDPDGGMAILFVPFMAPTLIACALGVVVAVGHLWWSTRPERRAWLSNEAKGLPGVEERRRVKDIVRQMALLGSFILFPMYFLSPALLLALIVPFVCFWRVGATAQASDRIPRGVTPVVIAGIPGFFAALLAIGAVPFLAPFLLAAAAGIAILPWQLVAVRRAELANHAIPV